MNERFECLRCGHTWKKRKDCKPKICPKCKSKVWHTKRPIKVKMEKGTAPKSVNDYILNNF